MLLTGDSCRWNAVGGGFAGVQQQYMVQGGATGPAGMPARGRPVAGAGATAAGARQPAYMPNAAQVSKSNFRKG